MTDTKKIALVTGANKGIGLEIARQLAEAGVTVIMGARDFARGEAAARGLSQAGLAAEAIELDLNREETINAAAAAILARRGRLDILVNNAGTILRAPAAEHSDEYWDKVINVNLNSQFILTREIGKDMVARGCGKIVFTASLPFVPT